MQSLNIEWLFLQIYNLFFGGGIKIGGPGQGFKNFMTVMLILLAIGCTMLIIYTVIKIRARRHAEHHKFDHAIEKAREKKEDKKDKRWTIVLDFITSNNPSDWRVAVLEADNLLDDMTMQRGFPGENLGERLKNASPHHFRNLDNAWEAHKIRNKIAHEGMGFVIEYKEAKRAIEMYELALKEFDFI